MPEDKNYRGEKDRNRMAADNEWEVEYLIDQFGATRKEINEAIKAVGNDKEKVEEYLRNKRVF